MSALILLSTTFAIAVVVYWLMQNDKLGPDEPTIGLLKLRGRIEPRRTHTTIGTRPKRGSAPR